MIGDETGKHEWRASAAHLAAHLAADGYLHDPLWHGAFAQTPRHLLMPGPVDTGSDEIPSWWLDAVYSDAPLTSAEPAPGVLAWLLEMLIPDGDTAPCGQPRRVLELGAGSGYTTALLCHRLGDEHVTATDPHTADSTRATLASLGLYPCLVTAQGVRGASAYGPFDAILRTTRRAAVMDPAWLAQLADGGRIVAATGDERGPAANVYERNESGAVHCRTVRPGTDSEAGAP